MESSPQGRILAILANREDLSVEDFLNSRVPHAVPWSTGLKSLLSGREEQAAGLDRTSLKSQSRRLIHGAIEDLMDGTIRATRRAHEDKIQKEIEAEWGPRCKDWLNRQRAQLKTQLKEEVLAEQNAQNRQHWLDTQGESLRQHFIERSEATLVALQEKQAADYKQRWDSEERHKYQKYLRTCLESKVKKQLREELKPAIIEELRTIHLPALVAEARRGIIVDIHHNQQVSHFATDVTGPGVRARLSANHDNVVSEHDDSGLDPLVRVREASARFNSVMDSGHQDRPEIRHNIETDTYNRGLFNEFPLDARNYNYGPQIHHRQPSYIPNAQACPSGAVRNHGIVGEPIVPRRVQAPQTDSLATQSNVAPRRQSQQPIPALSASGSSNAMATGQGTMLPPPRPGGLIPARLVLRSQNDHMQVPKMSGSTRPDFLMEKNEAPNLPSLLEAHSASMVSQHAQEQADRDHDEVSGVQVRNIRDLNTALQASNKADKGGSGKSASPNLEAQMVDSDKSQSRGQQQGQDGQVQEQMEKDRNRASRVQTGEHHDSAIELDTADPGAKPADSHGTNGPVQQQGQKRPTGAPPSQTTSVPSQRGGKKRARSVVDETGEADIRRDIHGSRDEAAKRQNKRARVNPIQENINEGPSTRTRAAAKKAAVGKPQAKIKSTKSAGGGSTNTMVSRLAPVAVPTDAGAKAPPPLPSQQPASARARPALRSGQLKRGRDSQEAKGGDEARTSPPPAKRVRHAVARGHASTVPTPDVAIDPIDPIIGASSKQEKPVAGRPDSKGSRSTSKEKAAKSPPASKGEKGLPGLGSPFVPYTGRKRPNIPTEWDTDSDD